MSDEQATNAHERKQTATTVANAPAKQRYEVTADGELAGFTEYVDRAGQRIFVHTEIDERFGGRGLGSMLLEHALSDTRTEGKRVVPICSFVANYLDRHHDFDDIRDPVTPEARAAAGDTDT